MDGEKPGRVDARNISIAFELPRNIILLRCKKCQKSVVVQTGSAIMCHGPNTSVRFDNDELHFRNTCPSCGTKYYYTHKHPAFAKNSQNEITG